jgi:hypothetical protein
MSRILNKLIRLAQEEHRPVFMYDLIRDEATVLMDFESYERGSFGMFDLHNLNEENEELDLVDDEFEENDEIVNQFFQNKEVFEPNIQSLEKLEESVQREVESTLQRSDAFESSEQLDEEALIEQSNKDLALYQVKREEKEREEIAKVLEEELEADPLPDPFEEDFIRPSQWHELSDITQLFPPLESEDQKMAEVEPSYHPIAEAKIFPTSMNWSTWDEASRGAKSIPLVVKENIDFPKDEPKFQPESLSEDPIFLEEPLS